MQIYMQAFHISQKKFQNNFLKCKWELYYSLSIRVADMDLSHLGIEGLVCIFGQSMQFEILDCYSVREVFLSDSSGLRIRNRLVSENLRLVQLAYFFLDPKVARVIRQFRGGTKLLFRPPHFPNSLQTCSFYYNDLICLGRQLASAEVQNKRDMFIRNGSFHLLLMPLPGGNRKYAAKELDLTFYSFNRKMRYSITIILLFNIKKEY